MLSHAVVFRPNIKLARVHVTTAPAAKRVSCLASTVVRALPVSQRATAEDLQRLATDLTELSQRLSETAVHWPSENQQDVWQQQKELWARQERLWQRELDRWDEERKMWASREAALLTEVQRLQEALRLALQQAGQAPPAATANVPPSTATTYAIGSAGAHLGQLHVTQAFTPPGTPQAAQPGTSSSIQLVAPVAGAATSEDVPAFARSLAAAISAADHVDVLGEVDFEALAKRLQPQPATGSTVLLTGSSGGAVHATVTTTASGQGLSSVNTTIEVTAAGQDPAPPSTAREGAGSGAGRATAAGADDEPDDVSLGFDPEGPPPILAIGSDDVVWVGRLHQALAAAGFHASDEELEDFLFGPVTEDALLFFQASCQLPETGIADAATWEKLLGKPSSSTPAADATNTHGGSPPAAAAPRPSATEIDGWPPSSWPVLREGDGGHAVHALHVALGRAGCFCGEDDLPWWMFGNDTRTALLMFQACNGLPESGVCDQGTWRALLGPDAEPADLAELKDGEHDEDMAHSGRMWLVGEGRWANS